MIRTYSEMLSLTTIEERYKYLRIPGVIGESTFGSDRYLNQVLYQSPEWKRVRSQVIVRDNGCDLGIDDWSIEGRIIVHHINPITVEQIMERDPSIFDLENLICCSENVHNAIHFGDERLIPRIPKERRPNDMIPWR